MHQHKKKAVSLNVCLYTSTFSVKKKWVGLILCFVSFYANAQLCTGSLGDPIVNITFGNGSPVGAPLGSAVTSYRYMSDDCPLDGSYSVRSTTTNCFGTWHTINADHTGDAQGRFMLVNASFDPGDFYVKTVSGLCANTTFEFAAWLMNLVRIPNQIMPNITFTIEKKDGTVLESFQTGNLDVTGTPQWKKYGFNFKTPPGVFDVVLRIKNNAPGGIGNDIALDDITFRACGPSVINAIEGSTDTLQLCEGDAQPFVLKAAVPSFFANPRFQWQYSNNGGVSWKEIPGATDLQMSVNIKEIGRYWYRLSAAEAENFDNSACRVVSNVMAINIHANPKVSAGPDKVVVRGEVVALQGSLQGEQTSYSWSPSDFLDNSSLLMPNANPLGNITYTLSAESLYGCIGMDSVFIKVINGVYIPTSFSPNSDGLNDSWRIPNIEFVAGAEVKVYNRYGNLVFQGRGGNMQWNGNVNGKPQPSGIYIYQVTIKTVDRPLKGFVTLIR